MSECNAKNCEHITRLYKELEDYKNALYLSATDIFVEMKGDLPSYEQLEDEVNYYLQEARKEE